MRFTKDGYIKFCLALGDASLDYPFGDGNAVLRHPNNRKWFALLWAREDTVSVNLKCDPYDAIVYRGLYEAVVPAYHMNKEHWITVDVNALPREAAEELTRASYALTAPKSGARRQTPKPY